MVSNELLEAIRKDFALQWHGIHGLPHWVRVQDNGLRLARLTGADPAVVELFAYLHDARRFSNGFDLGHGKRAAALVEALRGSLIELDDDSFEHLVFACKYHSDGLVEADVSVQTCWDADRLDLGRVGIKPEAQYLCTPAAKESAMIEWAYRRSVRRNDHEHEG